MTATGTESAATFGDGFRRIRKVVEFLDPPDGEASPERVMAMLHPEIEVMGAPGIGPAHGYSGLEDFGKYFVETAEQGILLESDTSAIVIAPSGAILVTATLRLSAPDGQHLTPAWFVLTFRDDLIASLETHLSQRLAEESLASK